MSHLNREGAKALLRRLIADRERDLAAALAPLDPEATFDVWFNTFRAIEEFINLPRELKDHAFREWLIQFPISNIVSASRA